MKKLNILLVLFAVLFSFKSTAQCIADAGPDKIICQGMYGFDTTQIGSIIPATGGTAPYSYTWRVNGAVAYGFLDNPALANPLLIHGNTGDSLVLVLTVTDANGITCSDEMIVRFSHFVVFTSDPMAFEINQGDSVFLAGWILTSSNYSGASYIWRPNTGLNDSTSAAFWAKPDVSTVYSVKVTNALGCTSTSVACYDVHVKPLSIESSTENLNNITVYPNPVTDIVYLKSNIKIPGLSINVMDITGRIILTEKRTMDKTQSESIDFSSFRPGVYIIETTDIHNETSRFKIVKQ